MTTLENLAESVFKVTALRAEENMCDPMIFAVEINNKVEFQFVPARYGDILNNGKAKDVLFAFWRDLCRNPAITAFATGSEAWMFESNEKGRELYLNEPKKHKSLVDSGFKKLVAGGYGTVREVFQVAAQNHDDVFLINRVFTRDGGRIVWSPDPPAKEHFKQEHFNGRQKMWGDLRKENLG